MAWRDPSLIPAPPARDLPAAEGDLARRYQAVRSFTEALCEPLAVEDYVIQSMPDVSPTKWHLAHTSWFFETFLLTASLPGYRPFHPQFGYLFNSYYNAVGERHCRHRRGLLSRPTVAEVYQYRAHVDRHMQALLCARGERLAPLVEIGLHHEQQHQELLLTDIKHVFAANPLRPVYRERAEKRHAAPPAVAWCSYPGGVREIGHAGQGFAFDNETPRHRVFLEPFQLASRLVTSGEYLAFVQDGGYRRPELWLSDGWSAVQAEGWEAPLYWEAQDSQWWQMTLAGMRPVDPAEPVAHVSFYEADAFATWAGARLPSEAEWEVAATDAPRPEAPRGNFADDGRFHPVADCGLRIADCGLSDKDSHADSGASIPNPGCSLDAVIRNPQSAIRNPQLRQLYGDVWEWTSSAYRPYPGFRPLAGALGEYNGKFMCSQMVLRGGSCVTSRSHIRPTYRNFFPPGARWQFSGLRLARDA